jgi:transcriptional regulator with XRE-family HTH domain
MALSQDNFSGPENPVFQRLRKYQVGEGLTWEQVARKLGVGVSMLMMVKRGHRNLSPKALYRLEQAELEVAKRKSQAQRVVEGLLADEGTAAQLVAREDRNRKKLDLRVDYASARKTKACPTLISLRKPSEAGCAKLRELFAQTLDTTVILLACLPASLRNDNYLAQLTADSRSRLTNAALDLVIPNWRILVAGKIAVPK